MITWVDVTSYAPALTSTPSFVQTQILGYVNANVTTAWGDDQVYGQVLLACHMATLSDRARTVGADIVGNATKMSEGALSIEYKANASTSELGLDATIYGQLYLQIAKTKFAGGMFVT